MKRFLILSLILWALLFIIPIIAVRPWSEDSVVPLPVPVKDGSIDASTEITLFHNGKVETLPLDEYLAGVLSAEMPASFPTEALKAQAVAARTYTMNRASLAPSTEHQGAMVCSNSAHCKAYRPISEAAANWGDKSNTYTNKIRAAVSATDGEILLYDNKPISAVFFSMSSGKTERAVDVWGSDVPYLQSVESVGETRLENYSKKVTFSYDEFKKKLTEKYPNAAFGDDPSLWIKDITRSDAGGVMKLTAGGVSMKGSDFRILFSLRSTNFSLKFADNTVTIETRGYGHGVGLSQYGAKILAEEGKNYSDILSWYYKGVTFGKISK